MNAMTRDRSGWIASVCTVLAACLIPLVAAYA
jgi:hypothetical protein